MTLHIQFAIPVPSFVEKTVTKITPHVAAAGRATGSLVSKGVAKSIAGTRRSLQFCDTKLGNWQTR